MKYCIVAKIIYRSPYDDGFESVDLFGVVIVPHVKISRGGTYHFEQLGYVSTPPTYKPNYIDTSNVKKVRETGFKTRKEWENILNGTMWDWSIFPYNRPWQDSAHELLNSLLGYELPKLLKTKKVGRISSRMEMEGRLLTENEFITEMVKYRLRIAALS